LTRAALAGYRPFMSSNDIARIAHCSPCGAELAPGARYCANCGQEAGKTTDPAPPASTYWSDSASPPSSMPSYSALYETGGGGIGKLFSGEGRIGRLEWFLTVAGIWLVLLVAWGIMYAVDAAALTVVLGLIIFVVSTIVAICAGVKRLHDFDQSGWLYLLMIVPLVSFIMLLVLLFMSGSSGQNRYGFKDSGSVME
jgi:uncharacterized membrane protein YhaH (DUF805 family)